MERDPRQFREDVNPVMAEAKRWTGALDDSGRMGIRSMLDEKVYRGRDN